MLEDQPRMLHFLLAEDDDDHAQLVLRNLKRNRVGNSVDRVANGVELLSYLHKEGEYAAIFKRPDLILLDLNMPRMGGLEALDKVKAEPELRDIPVVILTTSDAETDRARAYQSYANSYLVKPLDFTQFSKMIEELSLYWGVWNRPAHGL